MGRTPRDSSGPQVGPLGRKPRRDPASTQRGRSERSRGWLHTEARGAWKHAIGIRASGLECLLSTHCVGRGGFWLENGVLTNPPAFIDPEAWAAFHESRRKLKAPLTAYAEKLIIRELVKLKCAGHDPMACLEQSIMNGWRDVFPLRDKGITASVDVDADIERRRAEHAEQTARAVKPPAAVLELAKRMRAG